MGYYKGVLPGPGPGGGGPFTLSRASIADTAPTVAQQLTIGVCPVGATIVRCWVQAEGSGVVADDDDAATLTVYVFDAAGGLVSIVADGATTTIGAGGMGDLPAYASVTIPATVNDTVGAGESVVVEVLKIGVGVQLPAMLLGCDYELA
jgi:hypothetical protein